jgi:hypothetical protein
MTQPSTRSSKAIGALIGALAALSIGGVGLAFAQDATETPTTEAPAVETPAAPATPDADAPHARGDREDCPEKDGAAGGGSSSSSDSDTSTSSADTAGEV